MSDDVIARAEAALEGVSEGDWGVDPYPHYDLDDWQTDNFSSLTAEELASAAYYDVDGGNGEWIAHCGERADAEFIAAARSLLPELVAELKTTRAQLERARLAQGDVPDLSEFVQPQFLADYKAWYAAVATPKEVRDA